MTVTTEYASGLKEWNLRQATTENTQAGALDVEDVEVRWEME